MWHASWDKIKNAREQTVFETGEAMMLPEVSMSHASAGVAAAKLQASLNKLEKCHSCFP